MFDQNVIRLLGPISLKCCSPHVNLPGPSCSKLPTSLVNDSLKFTLNDMQIYHVFWNQGQVPITLGITSHDRFYYLP